MSDKYYPEPPDYKHFARLPRWTIDEAISLLAIAQIRYLLFDNHNAFAEALNCEKTKIERVLNAVDENGLRKLDDMDLQIASEFEGYILEYSISRKLFLEWADEKLYTPIPTENIVVTPENMSCSSDEIDSNHWKDNEALVGGDLRTTSETSVNGDCLVNEPTDTVVQSEEVQERRTLLLNSLRLNGIETDLILPKITAVDMKYLYDLIKPPEKPDPVNLAAKNDGIRKRKVKATNYMLRQIQAGCRCNHPNLAKVAFEHNSEWNDTPNKTLSPSQLKELSMLIVLPERRYSSNQHTANSLYKPASCKCSRPGHN